MNAPSQRQRGVSRIALSAAAGAVLAAALSFAFPALAHTRREAGATSSAIDGAAFFIAGAGVGCGIGALLASILHRSRPRGIQFESGVVAGFISASLALIPTIIVVEHGDIVATIGGLIAAAIITTPFVLAGAGIGTLLRRTPIAGPTSQREGPEHGSWNP